MSSPDEPSPPAELDPRPPWSRRPSGDSPLPAPSTAGLLRDGGRSSLLRDPAGSPLFGTRSLLRRRAADGVEEA